MTVRMRVKTPPLGTPFSHQEWAHSNLENYRSSEAARQRAHDIRNEALQLVEDRKTRTDRSQSDATLKINERVRDTNQWRRDLQREMGLLKKETEDLVGTRRELEHAMLEMKRPEDVCNSCLSAREYRCGIDQVKDAVWAAIDTELRDVKRIQEGMRQHHDLVEGQILDNISMQERLQNDLRDKDAAMDIDQTCHILGNTSHEIDLHPGISNADITKSAPQSWAKFSDKNIEDSTAARFKSSELRGNVEGLLSTSCNELMTAWSTCNRTFKERIMETEDAQNLLRNHLSLTDQEIVDLDEHIGILKKAIADKLPPLKVAETRLDCRVHRPGIEACNDAPHNKLVQEVDEINASIQLLRDKLAEADGSRQELLKTRSNLRQDIRVKENSLRIDRGKCMGARLRFPFNQRCSRKCQYKWCSSIALYIMQKSADGLHLATTDLHCYE